MTLGNEVCLTSQQEKIGIWVVKAKSSVPYHCEDSFRINFLLCILGCDGAGIVIKGVFRPTPAGKVIAFHDQFQHMLVNNGNEDRYAFLMSILHPDYASAFADPLDWGAYVSKDFTKARNEPLDIIGQFF